MPPFKAGLVLEDAVSRGLNELKIGHRRTDAWGHEDTREAVDLVVFPTNGRPAFEIQLTLMRKHEHKRMNFTLAALSKRLRGVRVYLEVVASHRREDLNRVGAQIANAIQTIVTRFRNFGPYNLLGVSVNAKNGAIGKFDLVKELGVRLRTAARRVLDQIETITQTNSTRTSQASPLIHLGVAALNMARMHAVANVTHQPVPHRANRLPTRRSFIPRRFY